MSGDGLVFIERERGRFAQSLVRERGKKTQKVVSSSLLFFNGERDCVVGILASLCLSIYFNWFYLIHLFLFVSLGIGRQCFVIWGLTLENVKGGWHFTLGYEFYGGCRESPHALYDEGLRIYF